MKTTVFLAVLAVGIAYAMGVTIFYETCNENNCVTRVSKCQLTGACGCTLDNCTCCLNCTLCLAELWEDCCACVSMCKPRNISGVDVASYSTIGDLRTSETWTDTLFKALTLGKPMPESHWTVDRVTPEEEGVNLEGIVGTRVSPSEESISGSTAILPGAKQPTGSALSTNVTISPEDVCTVAYVKICLGLEKCVDACHHMGAAKYRWFHTGCCECIGRSCLSYGKNKALCSECPND